MFNKLRSNYQLSNLIVRIFFVLTFIFCNWQDLLAATNIALSMSGANTSLAIPMMLLCGLLMAVVLMLIIPFLANFVLNFLHLYNVPRAEYVLITMLFFTIGFFACGVLNLVNLFTPLLLTWGSVIFPLVVSLGCVIGFYKVTSNLYFNDVTKPYYFKSLAIVYIAVAFILGVVA